jgi:dipeptidyl aminopeptidase/acylaminoacyl peptidase
MKYIIIVIHFLFFHQSAVFSQGVTEKINLSLSSKEDKKKTSLDYNALLQWDVADRFVQSISNDGRYFTYGYKAAESTQKRKVLIVQSTDKSWKREFKEALPITFSSDNKTIVFQRLDTLFFLLLGSENSPRFITNVTSCKTPKGNNGEWIAFQLKNDKKTVVLKNLVNDKEYQYESVSGYEFNNNGNCMVLQVNNGKLLQWISFKTMSTTDIFQTRSGIVNSIAIDSKGAQVVFTVQEQKNGESENSVWYYKQGMDKAVLKIDKGSAGIENGLYIQSSVEFSKNEKYIFLKLQYKSEVLKPRPDFIKLNIWNYQDSLLQSYQVKHPAHQRTYTAAVTTDETQPVRVLRIEKDHELLFYQQRDGDYVVVADNTINEKRGDRFWMPFLRDHYLASLKDGSRTLLKQHGQSSFYFSPSGRYLVCYDELSENYYSYDLESLRLKGISNVIPKGWLTKTNEIYYTESHTPVHTPVGIASWLPNDAGVLVYDNYDIWLLDLKGNKVPVNLTEGYGRTHHVKFNVFEYDKENLITSDSLVVLAYNMKTKYNGFYQISIKNPKKPILLYMGPYTFYHWSELSFSNHNDWGIKPLKAKNDNKWIVDRQSFNEAPNYFLTSNFKHFQQLTEFKPQTNCNWLTAELIQFKQMDGTVGYGTLYKPENFDPNKKYPVLFNYYTDMTNILYTFLKPRFTEDAFINIPYFVSQGYLIFTPDIYLTKYHSGPSAYNSVVGAAKWMAQQPFVDSKRMGIAGHSYAGGLTNYLVTHTNIFAAAFEGAGVSDLISSSLQIVLTNGTSRLNATNLYPLLWEQPAPWIKNSPILNADKVTSPLLMFHCRPDGAVPFEQAVEFYLALQRLDKKVWLVEYEDGDHAVEGKNAQDLTIRVMQYFDHYLKNAPAPIWMTKGIPARLKGVITAYELDPSGNCGKDCKVCKMWNEKMKKDSTVTMKEIEERKIKENWQ